VSQSRKCRWCGEVKALENFDQSKQSRQCNTCKLARRKATISSSPFNYMHNLHTQLKYARKKQGYKWSITPKDLYIIYAEQEGKCALTGVTLTYNKGVGVESEFNISIDRIDSSGDYTVENIQLLGKVINFLKHDIPQEKFIKLVNLIYNNTNG